VVFSAAVDVTRSRSRLRRRGGRRRGTRSRRTRGPSRGSRRCRRCRRGAPSRSAARCTARARAPRVCLPARRPRTRLLRGCARAPRAGGRSRRRLRRARDLRPDRGAAAGWAGDVEASVERFDAVEQAAQSGAGVRAGAADAVVGDLDRRCPVLPVGANVEAPRSRVLGRVRERLGDDVVAAASTGSGSRSSGAETLTGSGLRAASVSSAAARPRSLRICGSMPCASSRSSSSPGRVPPSPRRRGCGPSRALPTPRSHARRLQERTAAQIADLRLLLSGISNPAGRRCARPGPRLIRRRRRISSESPRGDLLPLSPPEGGKSALGPQDRRRRGRG
jgi:hypothetical protein